MSASDYHRQLLEARRVGLALIGRQEDLLLELLQEYAEEIERIVRRGFGTTAHRRLLAELEEVIVQLTRDMAASTGQGIRLTAERIAEIHARATVALAGETVVGAAFGGIGLQAAQAVIARPELSRAFVSIRRESIQTVDRILQRGILRGATPAQIARELRAHIAAPESLLEGDAVLLRDRRRIGYEAIKQLGYEPTPENLAHVRAEAGRIADRARLIARTEIATSAHEAAVQAAINSPVVAALRWTLSARHPLRDVCDLLAEGDFYGLGPGVYDPRAVPGKPHPRCLCYLREILRPVSEWGKPRGPVPARILDPGVVIEGEGLPPSQLTMLERAVVVGEDRSQVTPSSAPVVAASVAAGAPAFGDPSLAAEHARQLRLYGKSHHKVLQNGRVRYYGSLALASTPGEMRGRRKVREWDPVTGSKREWQQTEDHAGRPRIIRPTHITDRYYLFDATGRYVGTRSRPRS